MVHEIFQSSLGSIKLSADEGSLKKIEFLASEEASVKSAEPLLKEARGQIEAYLNGQLTQFDLPLDLDQGTHFQKSVWSELCRIGFGQWLSYSQVAQRIGNPKAVRAIGGAANKNPFPLVVPCHRVLGADGSMVGFAPGICLKKALLSLEGHNISGNSVI